MELVLGRDRFDVTHRAVVMGILNRTPDSFFEGGHYWELDAFLDRAAELVSEGADVLDIGGVTARPGPEVSVEEELDRVVPAIAAVHERFGTPIAVDTWSAAVAREAYAAGAVVGNDISGFGDPDYLAVAAGAGAAVVVTHIRLAPRVADPHPHYDDLVGEVVDFLVGRAQMAEASGVPRESIMVDAGLDLGKTEEQSLTLLRRSDAIADLGWVPFLSASNKRFIGHLLDLPVDARGDASHAAHALGIARGCRVLRAHDVTGARRTSDVMAAVLAARAAA